MKTRIALSLAAASLSAACTSTPTWDTSVFPQQVVYSQPSPAAPVVAEKK